MFWSWRKDLAKTKGERKHRCWISPQGDWYNVTLAAHEPFAISYMKDKLGEDYNGRGAGQALMNMGWLSIQFDGVKGVIVRGSDHMTPDQYMVLYEYWESVKLFGGWKIKDLWEKSKYNPKNLSSI